MKLLIPFLLLPFIALSQQKPKAKPAPKKATPAIIVTGKLKGLVENEWVSLSDVNVPEDTIAKVRVKNGSFKLNEMVILNPNAYVSVQAKSYEIVGGMNVQYNLSGDGEKTLTAGVYYRHKDALIPMIGLGIKDINFTFTYDATMSGLRNFNNRASCSSST